MKKLDIGAIRGDLNVFKRMVKAVEFAADAIEDHDARQRLNNELDATIKAQKQTAEANSNDLATAKAALKKVNDAAGKVISDANDEAARIIQQAKNESTALRSGAQDDVKRLKGQKADLQTQIEELQGQVGRINQEKEKAQGELTKMTSSLKSALDRVTPSERT